MKLTTPICDFVKRYEKEGISRLHMPGHKGMPFLGCEKLDMTEIAGADQLYDATGIIAESERNAGELFGFGKTLYSTEGSSQCIRAMLFLALQGAEGRKPVVLAARNAHKAFLYACALLDLEVEWLLPQEGGTLCTCPVTPKLLENRLAELAEKPIAFYLTAPDYLGYSPDIKGLAEVCKKADIPLLVDNAHGAYLKFLSPSRHPLDLGAAMSCDSAHKTLPVLTGGAYLQLSRRWAEKVGQQAKGVMELFGSTSPSYLILQSLDRFNQYACEGYAERLQKTIVRVERTKEELKKQGWHIFESDPLKITILTGKRGYTGKEAAAILRKNGVECEFADLDSVVLMATAENAELDFQRIERALHHLPQKAEILPISMPLALPKKRMSVRQAVFASWEAVSLDAAVGRICAAPCISCPPAIPIVVSGEEITVEMAALFRAYGIERVKVVKA